MPFLFDTPDPPNPIVTAAAQTGSNVSTAVANANLNNINQVTPQGSLSYDVTGNFDWSDPTTGQTYSIPRFTATQTQTPIQSNIQAKTQGSQAQLAHLAEDQAYRLRMQFERPFDINQAPAFGDPSTLSNAPRAQGTFADVGNAQRYFGDAGPIGTTFGLAPDVQRTYQHGDDFSADRQRIEEGLMQRLNPSLAIERNRYQQQLADQGIRPGSPAYENMMRNYAMQSTDARLGVIGQGGMEQQRLSDMARQAGEFGNKAQQQIYEQAKGRGEFANEAQRQLYEQQFGRGQYYNAGQQQDFSQAAQRGTFGNAALAQNFAQSQSAFNANNAARQQWLDEAFQLRNQPINEITALLSGSQVSSPNFVKTGTSTIPTTDIAGLLNRNFDQQMAASNQQSATANNIIGGLFGFAGGMARGGAFA